MKFRLTNATAPRGPENTDPNESGWNARLMLFGVGLTVGIGLLMAYVTLFD